MHEPRRHEDERHHERERRGEEAPALGREGGEQVHARSLAAEPSRVRHDFSQSVERCSVAPDLRATRSARLSR
jgi:hypothetical protein